MKSVLPLASAACLAMSAGTASAHQHALEGSEWSLAGDTGESVRSVTFGVNGRIFGSGGCNRFTGSYNQQDGKLTISRIAATRRACTPDIMAKESDFLAMLARVRGARVENARLTLMDGSGADLVTLTRREPK